MCDFHSIVVRRDGAIAHIPANSHSGAVEAAGWRENDQMADYRGAYFVEAEWDGKGEFLGVDQITRGEVNEKQRKKIDDHYTALAKLLADPASHAERMCLGRGVFAKPEYGDIRWKVLIDLRTPAEVVAKIAETPLFADGSEITSLHPAVTIVDGSFAISEGATFTAPALTEVSGYVYVRPNATFTAPALTKSGSVDVRPNATFTAPALTKSGSVDVSENATFTAPALTKSGSVYVSENVTFTAPALTEVSGSVYVSENATFTAPALTEVSGSVDVRPNATFTAPALTKSGSVDVSENATFSAPLLEGGKYDTNASDHPRPDSEGAL